MLSFVVSKCTLCDRPRLITVVCSLAALVTLGFASGCAGTGDEKMLSLGEWQISFPRPLRCAWSLESGSLRRSQAAAISVLAMCSHFGLGPARRDGLTGVDARVLEAEPGTSLLDEMADIGCCEFDMYKRQRRSLSRWRSRSGIEVVECQYGGRELGPEDVRKVLVLTSGSSALVVEARFAVTGDYSVRIDDLFEIKRDGRKVELR